MNMFCLTKTSAEQQFLPFHKLKAPSRQAGVCSIGWQLGARMLEKTDTKQGARLSKGQSGNPSGRPPGARNKTTLAVEALLDGEAEVLTPCQPASSLNQIRGSSGIPKPDLNLITL
jgi:hypothetical protein